MKKSDIVILIFQLLCGLASIGAGIYYIVAKPEVLMIVIFMLVGAGCIGMAIRTFLGSIKDGENERKPDDNDGKNNR